jgi:hypothetical protein
MVGARTWEIGQGHRMRMRANWTSALLAELWKARSETRQELTRNEGAVLLASRWSQLLQAVHGSRTRCTTAITKICCRRTN